jgi:hypothetical protein
VKQEKSRRMEAAVQMASWDWANTRNYKAYIM